jgi:hypothetical protein
MTNYVQHGLHAALTAPFPGTFLRRTRWRGYRKFSSLTTQTFYHFNVKLQFRFRSGRRIVDLLNDLQLTQVILNSASRWNLDWLILLRMDKPQIIAHVQKPMNFTLYDCRWIPSSAKFVVLGNHARGTGALQVWEVSHGDVSLVHEVWHMNAIFYLHSRAVGLML